MATLPELKRALQNEARTPTYLQQEPLSDAQYAAGFELFRNASNSSAYQGFILPQLAQLLLTHFGKRPYISVLEVGPGPNTILGDLPLGTRQSIRRYKAHEPNGLFATRLQHSLSHTSDTCSPLPNLEGLPEISRAPFGLQYGKQQIRECDKYDVVLFCHSLYGMKPKHEYIRKALRMLAEQRSHGGLVIVFHRANVLDLGDLVKRHSASYSAGTLSIADNDEVLDTFAPFMAGYTWPESNHRHALQATWRALCRATGSKNKFPNRLWFQAPEVMEVFNVSATAVTELIAHVPLSEPASKIKNRKANKYHPAVVFKPTSIAHVQNCVQWAIKHRFGLAIIGGGHSDHCVWPDAVSIDMGAFDQVSVLINEDNRHSAVLHPQPKPVCLIVAEAGTTTGDIIRAAAARDVTVPLGARPSVGAGLWLQGGIGHLARQCGLACDAIIGAVIISVASGEILRIGNVPSKHAPAGAIRPGAQTEKDILWAIRGAGTNFGIVISVVFQTTPAQMYSVRHSIIPLSSKDEAQTTLRHFNNNAMSMEPSRSADAFLYWSDGHLNLGMTTFHAFSNDEVTRETTEFSVEGTVASNSATSIVDGIGLFDCEMYVSNMHGGHAGGKTSAFKRCLFLKDIGRADIANRLITAIENRPTSLSYVHLLHGGGALRDIEDTATAFGCRDWDFACVITGVWCREQDGTEIASAAEEWVYIVAQDLLSVRCGAYGADLGPNPRDLLLAANAFGPNGARLGALKRTLDPNNVLRYSCPLPTASIPKLIVLFTGESGAGKDHCANACASAVLRLRKGATKVKVSSISEATKREYAAAVGADYSLLIKDRKYKENHRSALTEFFKVQVAERPCLPEEHFLDVVRNASDVDILFITGIRDEAPVATLSHLVPESKVIEVRIDATEQTRKNRGATATNFESGSVKTGGNDNWRYSDKADYSPCFAIDNNETGDKAAERFAEHHLLTYLDKDLERLASMVHSVHNFPKTGTEFRHVLNICQERGGLALCTSLIIKHFTDDWSKIDAVVSCETGGFVYASPLAMRVEVPLVLIREAGKLPPPTIFAARSRSYISVMTPDNSKEGCIEMERGIIVKGSKVVIVDDVLSTGQTLCAILQLLVKAGISAEDIRVMVVAEFPVHRGRELLRRQGFGSVKVQGLLNFGGT